MEKIHCINPADIQEGDLLAYLYGDAPSRVRAHIRRCAYCTEQVEQLRIVDQQLLAAFYRETCPTPEVLSDYVLRRLPDTERLRVAAHIRLCRKCAAEVAAVDDLGATVPTTLLQRLKETLALALAIHPVRQRTAPARGQGWQGRFERDAWLITVSTQPNELTGRVRQRGALTQDDCGGEAWLLLSESASEADTFHSLIDPQGRFHFASVQPDTYSLLLRVSGQYLTIYPVKVP